MEPVSAVRYSVWITLICFFFFTKIYPRSINAIYPIIYGCNDDWKTGFLEPNASEDLYCSYESSHHLKPELFNFESSKHLGINPYTIKDICTVDRNTIIFLQNKIFALGTQRGIITNPYKRAVPYPVLVYSEKYENGFCGFRNAFFWKFKEKELFGWGLNFHYELGVGEKAPITVPERILSNEIKFYQENERVSFIIDKSNKVFLGGADAFNYFTDIISAFYYHSEIGNYGDLISNTNDIIDISLGIKVLFIVLSNNEIYLIGDDKYNMNINNVGNVHHPILCDPTGGGDIIDNNFEYIQLKVNENSAFLLIKVNNTNKVYSWGYDSSIFLGRVSYANDWYHPKEIDSGELESHDEVMFINTAKANTFLITKSHKIYSFGYYNYGGFGTEIGFDFASSYAPLRILKNIGDDMRIQNNYFTIIMQENAFNNHYVFSIVKGEFHVGIEEILYISIPFSLVVVIVLIMFLFIFIMCVIYNKKMKNAQNSSNKDVKVDKEFGVFGNEDERSIARKQLLSKINIKEKLFTINKSDVKLLKTLGAGGSDSEVFLAEWYSKRICVKLFQTRLFGDQHDFDQFEREINICTKISHPNIIRFFGCCLYPPRVMILMEYCVNGDLEDYLLKSRRIGNGVDLDVKMRILQGIVCGTQYLHEQKIIHRDMKLKNVLITKDLSAKLIDFGLSRIITTQFSKKTKGIGTSHFMSPEIVLGSGEYDEKCDIFSIGIIIFIVLTEKILPYDDVKKESMGSIEIAVAQDPNLRPRFDDDSKFPEELIEICQKCWNHNPEARCSLNMIKNVLEEIMSEQNNVSIDIDMLEEKVKM